MKLTTLITAAAIALSAAPAFAQLPIEQQCKLTEFTFYNIGNSEAPTVQELEKLVDQPFTKTIIGDAEYWAFDGILEESSSYKMVENTITSRTIINFKGLLPELTITTTYTVNPDSDAVSIEQHYQGGGEPDKFRPGTATMVCEN